MVGKTTKKKLDNSIVTEKAVNGLTNEFDKILPGYVIIKFEEYEFLKNAHKQLLEVSDSISYGESLVCEPINKKKICDYPNKIIHCEVCNRDVKGKSKYLHNKSNRHLANVMRSKNI